MLPGTLYRFVVGGVLLYAVVRIWLSGRTTVPGERETAVLPVWLVMLAGALIGLVSGLVGIGGGIFLGPLLLLAGWADTRQTMGITAAFVLVNSAAGLAGNVSIVQSLPVQIPVWLLAAGAGGWLGAELSSRRLDPAWVKKLLALLLAVAALRLMFG
jgi:uncharacterized membrane protein YfcA